MKQRSQRSPQQGGGQGSPLSSQPLLSVSEAAALLGIKVWTLRQWLSQRKIAYVKVGRLTKLRPEDITAFIERNRREAVSFESRSVGSHAA
jgi:excisionase family DNA binding protein